MASEKITAIIDEVKALSVLELKELIDAYCEELLLLPLRLLLALLLLLRKRRPSSMSSWLMSALTRCRSSRLLRS